MPDSDVNVIIGVQDDLTPKLNQVKQAFGDLIRQGEILAKGIGKLGITPEQAFKMGGLSAEDTKALQAYVDSLKAVEEQSPKTAAAQKEVAGAQEQVGQSAGHAHSYFDRLLRRITEGFVIWQGLRFVLDQVKEAFTQAIVAQTDFVQWQNINRLSTDEASKSFDGLKDAAKAANVDFEKFAVPAAVKLREVGVPLKDINDRVQDLGEAFNQFGVDLSDVYAKAKLGTAGVGDFLKAAQALGPAFKQAALDFNKLVVQAPQFERHLQQIRTALARQHEDQEFAIGVQQRLQQAQLGFAEKLKASGPAGLGKPIAEQLLAYFGQAGTLRGAEYGIQLQLPSGVGADFASRQMAVIKQQLTTGLEQFAKDQQITMREAQALAGGGYLDVQTLMQAGQRAKEEERVIRDRENQLKLRQMEDQELAYQVSLETKRKELNDAIVTDLHKQVELIKQTSKESETVEANVRKAGNEVKGFYQQVGEAFNLLKGEMPARTREEIIEDQRRRAAMGGTVTPNAAAFPDPHTPRISQNTGQTNSILQAIYWVLNRIASD